MSQLFDSLRRGRGSSDPSNTTRTAHRDSVLTTLGYAPSQRRSGLASGAIAIALLLCLAAAVWLGWSKYLGNSPAPDTPRRAPAPALPRFTPAARSNSAPPPVPDTPPARRPPTPADGSAAREAAAAAEASTHSTSQPARVTSSAPVPHSDVPQPAVAANNDLDLALQYHRAGDFDRARERYRAILERDERNAQAHNNLGLLYQQKGLLTDSLRELERAITLEPRNAGTRNNYGVTLLMLGQTDRAAAEFHSALTIEPGNLDARVNLALTERTSGQMDMAKETLLEVLNRAPRNAAAHYNLAQLYDQTNEPARAVEHYRMFLENSGAEHADRAATVRARIAALSKSPE